MKKFLVALACAGLVASGLSATAGAGPSPGGYSSDNVEWVTHVPFNGPTATGANFFKSGGDHYMIVTSWHNFAIYNINDPLAPELVGNPVPFGFKFENEDVSTNGKIMLFSETIPQGDLHVWDIEDKSNPVLLATVAGAGDHTTTCILKCKWAYGSEGTITDLRDPANPVLMTEKWSDNQPPMGSTHDVTEVAPGVVLTSTAPMLLLDARKNPVKPKFLALTEPYEGNGLPFHSNLWPRNMKDRWIIAGGETCCGAEQCDESTAAAFMVWDTKGWQKSRTFKLVDEWWAYQGTVIDGGGIASAPFGCSPHWFTTQPGTWKNGGLVAVGWYNSGTRLLEVSSKGKISEAGWFLPAGGGTSGAYFINEEIIYAVDYQRGIDVLRYTGK
ncbi:MAG TPA: hypothetical protein VEV43_08255 [Actinomycetota bacterium]|nr:hypothetical protein [Actinomycetota bacterium]